MPARKNPQDRPLDYHIHDQHFLACPPTVQRKYFSSLERLRIAQSLSKTKPASSHGKPTSPRLTTPQSPRPSLARSNSSYFRNPAALWSRKPSSPTSETFSLSDAQWYRSLPSKVQKSQFTEEEQQFLSGTNPAVVAPDAADQRLFEFARALEANHSLPSLHTAFSTVSSPTSSVSTFDFGDDMDDAMMEAFHCLDQDDDLDLASTLDDYHRFYAPRQTKSPSSNHHPSFRRVMSLSSIQFKSSSSTSPPPPPLPIKGAATASPTPQQPNTPSSSSFRKDSFNSPNFSRPQAPFSHKPQSSTTTLDRAATHYQDPSARLKLRVYLGSPQKFDEAIEFGFPSMEDAEAKPMSRPSLSKRRFVTAPTPIVAEPTFLDDSTPSVFDALDASSDSEYDDDADEVQSLPERHSPYTPSEGHFNETYLLSPSVASQPSLPSTSLPAKEFPPPRSSSTVDPIISKPTIRRDTTDPLAEVLAGSREMTLRMTLTRPDLRADESVLYPTHPAVQRGRSSNQTDHSDPLALEQLPDLKEKGAIDIWDTLPPVKESGLKRMWRRVSGKNA